MRLFSDHYLAALSPTEQQWVEKVRVLCRDEIGPRAAEVAKVDRFAWYNFRLLARSGVVGTAFPQQYGGSGATLQLRIRLIEELGRVCTA